MLPVLMGCGGDPGVPGLLPGDDSGFGEKAVSEGKPLCLNCITFDEVAVLGDSTDAGMLVDTWLRVVRDSSGYYWVSQPGAIKVYAGDGTFSRQIGQAGSGPLEFRMPRPLGTDGDGRVHIIDTNQRETVVNRDFTYGGDRMFPGIPHDVVDLPNGDYVANMWVSTADGIGLPLHHVNGDRILRSFGVVHRPSSLETEVSSRRVLARDVLGQIFAARYHDYQIDVWSLGGQRLGELNGPRLNSSTVYAGAVTEANPPPSRVWAINVDAEQRLWVVTWRRRSKWRTWMKEVANASGQVRLEMKDAGTPYQVMFSCRVDVIDLSRHEIVARYDGPNMLLAFIGATNVAVAQEFTHDGSMRLRLWRLGLKLSGS